MNTFLDFLSEKRNQKLIIKIKKKIKHQEKLLKDIEKKIDKLIKESQKNYNFLNKAIKLRK